MKFWRLCRMRHSAEECMRSAQGRCAQLLPLHRLSTAHTIFCTFPISQAFTRHSPGLGIVAKDTVIARLITDRAKDILTLLFIASVKQHARARARKPEGHEFANAVGRTSEQNSLVSDTHMLMPLIAENDGGESSLRLRVPCRSAQDVDVSLLSELSKRRAKPSVNGPDRRSPDVGQDQSSHASSLRLSRDI
jgi:hypothetical protein